MEFATAKISFISSKKTFATINFQRKLLCHPANRLNISSWFISAAGEIPQSPQAKTKPRLKRGNEFARCQENIVDWLKYAKY